MVWHLLDELLGDVEAGAGGRFDLVEPVGLPDDLDFGTPVEDDLGVGLSVGNVATGADEDLVAFDRCSGCRALSGDHAHVDVAEAVGQRGDLVPAELLAEDEGAVAGVQFCRRVVIEPGEAADVDICPCYLAFEGKGRGGRLAHRG